MSNSFSAAIANRQVKSLLFLFGAFVLALFFTNWIVEGKLGGWSLEVLGLAAGAIVLSILANWRMGLYLFLAWLILEDFARKFMGNNMLVYFGKDILVAIVYLAFLFARKRRSVAFFRPPFWVPLMLFVWLGVLQIANPNSPSIFYGLLGFKLYFYYIPLMFLGYALICSEDDLRRFLLFNLAIAAVVALLGVIQGAGGAAFLSPRELAPELRPLGQLTRTAPISGARISAPTSVFVSSGRFAWYVILMFILGLGAVSRQLLRPLGRTGKLVLLGVGIIFLAAVMSASRGCIVYCAASVFVMGIGMLWGGPLTERGRIRLRKSLFRSALAIALVFSFMMVFFPEAVSGRLAFYYETMALSSPNSELIYRVRDYPVANFLEVFNYPEWPLGYGTGTGSLGMQYVVRILGAPPPPALMIENGYGTLLLEMGIPGPILWILWTTALVFYGWRVVKRLKRTSLFPVAFSILWFAFLLLFPFTYGGTAPYQNFVYNAYFWLLVGILFRLPTLTAESEARLIPHGQRNASASAPVPLRGLYRAT